MGSRFDGTALEWKSRRNNPWNRASDLGLGGTPLGASLFLAEKSHRELIARTGAEVSSIIYLTDGEGCEFAQAGRESTHVTCPRTRRTFKGKTMDAAMLNWIRETLGCNIVNFFMDSRRGVENAAQNGFSEVAEARMKSVNLEANFFERGAYRGWDNWLVVADNATLSTMRAKTFSTHWVTMPVRSKLKMLLSSKCPIVA